MAPKRLWAVPVEDGAKGANLIVARSGHVVLSTMQHVEEREPRGLAHVQKLESALGQSWTRMYVNSLAGRCCMFDPRGELRWQARDVIAIGEDPAGRIIATNDAHDMITLGPDGAELERRPVGDESWGIVGWSGDTPILSATSGQAVVEPDVYTLTDHELRRCDTSGKVLEKFALARTPFDAICKQQGISGFPESAEFPMTFDLVFDAKRDRFIASNWSLLPWLMSIGRDGKLDWLILLGDACCNTTCIVGDSIVHASSCGAQLSFISPAGQVTRTHAIPELRRAFADDERVCAVSPTGVAAFDAAGKPLWSIERDDVGAATVHGDRLYVVAGTELVAFAL